jgi:lysosomal acid lipase/cholesteryl ester hydrolase
MEYLKNREIIALLLCLSLIIFPLDLETDANRTTFQMALHRGYPVEEFTVTSSDGYILTIFRIPGGKNTPLSEALEEDRQPLILQHGLVCSSDNFLDNGDKAPAYLFADAGYDVWLPNIRGNRYSQKHQKYTVKDKEFWDFTFEDFGVKDQEAYFNFILKHTGYEKVAFIGHSQGTAQMFAALTLQPEFYAKHLAAFIALGPVTKLDQAATDLVKLAIQLKVIEVFELFKVHSVFPYNYKTNKLSADFCVLFPAVCNLGLSISADALPEYDNQERLPIFLSHYPAGASRKDFEHILQLSEHAGFHRFRENKNDELIPYDFCKIPDIPIAVGVGAEDKMASVADARWLKEQLEKCNRLNFYEEYENMGHLTFNLPVSTFQYIDDALQFLKTHYTRK